MPKKASFPEPIDYSLQREKDMEMIDRKAKKRMEKVVACKYAVDESCPAYSKLIGGDFQTFYNTTSLFGCFDKKDCKKCGIYGMIAEYKGLKMAMEIKLANKTTSFFETDEEKIEKELEKIRRREHRKKNA